MLALVMNVKGSQGAKQLLPPSSFSCFPLLALLGATDTSPCPFHISNSLWYWTVSLGSYFLPKGCSKLLPPSKYCIFFKRKPEELNFFVSSYNWLRAKVLEVQRFAWFFYNPWIRASSSTKRLGHLSLGPYLLRNAGQEVMTRDVFLHVASSIQGRFAPVPSSLGERLIS